MLSDIKMAVPYYTSIVRPKRRRGAGERERKEWAGAGREKGFFSTKRELGGLSLSKVMCVEEASP
jgi:hypothetical protein